MQLANSDKTSNVTYLELVQREPNQKIIRMLADLLNDALRGELVGLAATAERADGGRTCLGCGTFTDHIERGYFAASQLAAKFMAKA